MGVVLRGNLDTNLGSSKGIYIRIENINLNRTFGKVKVAVTYWVEQSYSDSFKHSTSRHPEGQIINKVFWEDSEGEEHELELPLLFEFDLTKPERVKIPIYTIETVTEEVPYLRFDELGRRQTAYRSVKRQVKTKVGEKDDITQVLDFDIEKTLISWCYGQVKAQLAKIVPGEFLEDA